METVLIMSGLMVATLLITANYLVKGIGGMSAPLQQIGLLKNVVRGVFWVLRALFKFETRKYYFTLGS